MVKDNLIELVRIGEQEVKIKILNERIKELENILTVVQESLRTAVRVVREEINKIQDRPYGST